MFKTEKEAKRYFKEVMEDNGGGNIEQCEICGLYTISQADDSEGGIVGAYCPESENGGALFDRVCEDCSQKPEEEVRKIANEIDMKRNKGYYEQQAQSKEGTTIGTAAGTAYYVRTEIEDSNGKWNDSYTVRDGYWVIHRGREHDVYRVKI